MENSDHFHLLANLPTDKCVFPSLFSLSFIVDHPYARCLHLFLSPTLRRCNISAIHPNFTYIATRFAALEHLSIEPFDDGVAGDPLLFNSVRLCKQLATLFCPPLNLAAWKHISNLPTLLTVKITEPRRASHWPLSWNTHDSASFCNLTGLFFYVNTAAYTIAAIQHSEFPSLQEFVMKVSILPLAEAEQLCRALSQCKANQSLKRIDRISHGLTSGKPSSTVITQFFCFTQLRILQFDFFIAASTLIMTFFCKPWEVGHTSARWN